MKEVHLVARLAPGLDFGDVLSSVRVAEDAAFDAVLVDDLLAGEGKSAFEPATLMAALAAATSRVGLIATASTTWYAPFHVARAFATLDLMSAGRAGWHVVTAATDAEAANFDPPATADLDGRAEEFFDVVTGLWDTFDDDAFHHDQATGLYFDPTKLHTLDHVGPHLSVAGPLNVARPPQGRPLIVHSAATGFAARTADVIVHDETELAAATGTYEELKASGRDDVKVLARLPAGADPDHVTAWTTAADGFVVTDLAHVAGTLVPELRRRGLFRTGHTGATLREHFGVARPPSRHATTG